MSSWLFAWLAILGISLGSMASVMLHTLTGGRWGEVVRGPLLAATRLLPFLALLGLPLLFGSRDLYPLAESGWFGKEFFAARSFAYLGIWAALAFFHRPASKPFAAAGLIVYLFTMSLASTDWIVSLVPEWYSSGFGLVVISGQMTGAMAFAVAAAGLREQDGSEPTRQHYHDLGNLLLAFVMLWAYVAYTQFLIIWAADLPRELSWYLPRLHTGWVVVGALLVVIFFVAPFAILLSRNAKRSPRILGSIAAGLAVAYLVDVYWLIAPSIRPERFVMTWSDAIAIPGMAVMWVVCRRRADA